MRNKAGKKLFNELIELVKMTNNPYIIQAHILSHDNEAIGELVEIMQKKKKLAKYISDKKTGNVMDFSKNIAKTFIKMREKNTLPEMYKIDDKTHMKLYSLGGKVRYLTILAMGLRKRYMAIQKQLKKDDHERMEKMFKKITEQIYEATKKFKERCNELEYIESKQGSSRTRCNEIGKKVTEKYSRVINDLQFNQRYHGKLVSREHAERLLAELRAEYTHKLNVLQNYRVCKDAEVEDRLVEANARIGSLDNELNSLYFRIRNLEKESEGKLDEKQFSYNDVKEALYGKGLPPSTGFVPTIPLGAPSVSERMPELPVLPTSEVRTPIPPKKLRVVPTSLTTKTVEGISI